MRKRARRLCRVLGKKTLVRKSFSDRPFIRLVYDIGYTTRLCPVVPI